jgi:hypothetical protein
VDLKISEVRENYCNSASSLANSEPTVGWSAATRSKSEADLKLGSREMIAEPNLGLKDTVVFPNLGSREMTDEPNLGQKPVVFPNLGSREMTEALDCQRSKIQVKMVSLVNQVNTGQILLKRR